MYFRVAERSDGAVRGVRPLQQKGLTTTLDAEAVVSGTRAVRHGAGTRQKFKNRWKKTPGIYTRLPLAF